MQFTATCLPRLDLIDRRAAWLSELGIDDYFAIQANSRYIPEHFLTPILLAQKHSFFIKRGLNVQLVPQPSGTGQLISSYKEGKIDAAIGLTEGFVNGLAATPDLYRLIGTYVASPLCWAISAGAKNHALTKATQLRNGKIGVSRIGSGSFVMSYVFADQQGWLDETKSAKAPFEFVKLDTFKGLRDGVNNAHADAFMWERFTTKKYYDSGEIKEIGEIYTPWPSWLITATPALLERPDQLSDLLESINEGIKYFLGHYDEGIEHIYTNLDYSKDDAEAWFQTVRYPDNVKDLNRSMIAQTIKTLRKTGLMTENLSIDATAMIATVQ
jgi:ABC-type nitrate/sulfonate/bicarbonate transport system substrate-binding protein